MLPKKRKFTASEYENFETTEGCDTGAAAAAAAAASERPNITVTVASATSTSTEDLQRKRVHKDHAQYGQQQQQQQQLQPASPEAMVVDLSTPRVHKMEVPAAAVAPSRETSPCPRQQPRQQQYFIPAHQQHQTLHHQSPTGTQQQQQVVHQRPRHPQQQPASASPSSASASSSRNNTPVFGSSGVQIRRLSTSGYHDDSAYYSGGGGSAKYGSPLERKSPAYLPVKRELQPSPLTTNAHPRPLTAAVGVTGPPPTLPPPLAPKSESSKFDLDLRDWIGHRVLARRDQYFCPGVVKNVYEGYSVSILFDGEEQPLVYHEVLARGELDTVISDSVPATSQVN
jgi:hypothetical protein